MIFQILYKTNKDQWKEYFECNKKYYSSIIEIFDDDKIDYFIKKNNYTGIINLMHKKPCVNKNKRNVLITDLIRMLILFENPTYIYFDVDVVFQEEVNNIFHDLQNWENVIDSSLSFYFIKCSNRNVCSKIINKLLLAEKLDYPKHVIDKYFFYKHFKMINNTTKYALHKGLENNV